MFYIKQGDTSPAFRVTLRSNTGAAVIVTGATIMFHMVPTEGGLPSVAAEAEVVDGLNGVVRYVWAVGDTAVAGAYRAEFEVTFVDGAVETFPNSDYLRVKIRPQLA